MTNQQRIAEIDEQIRRLNAERMALQIGIDYPALDNKTIEAERSQRSRRCGHDGD